MDKPQSDKYHTRQNQLGSLNKETLYGVKEFMETANYAVYLDISFFRCLSCVKTTHCIDKV